MTHKNNGRRYNDDFRKMIVDLYHSGSSVKDLSSEYGMANKELRTVMQYYEFEWDDYAFGLDEHTWLKYTGAYKNVKPETEDDGDEVVEPLVSRTKLSGTQVIDAALLAESVAQYSLTKKGIIPYIDDLQRSIDYEEARTPAANPLFVSGE